MTQVQEKSTQIIKHLLPYLHGTIGIYMAYGKEVDVRSLLEYQELICCVPVTQRDHCMQFYQVDKDTAWTQGTYGIAEPIHTSMVHRDDINVMVVPMVAFDEKKNRMGHGKGYYDRYLKDYHGLKIGVAFACQKLKQMDVYPHDIPMDMIITENTVYR